jgi:hypothetical protein
VFGEDEAEAEAEEEAGEEAEAEDEGGGEAVRRVGDGAFGFLPLEEEFRCLAPPNGWPPGGGAPHTRPGRTHSRRRKRRARRERREGTRGNIADR